MLRRMREAGPSAVLVTGAGGFIGSVVTRELAAAGVPVRALIAPPGSDLVLSAPGISSSFAEITDARAVDPLVRGIGTIVHMAGPPSVRDSFRVPADHARIHVIGTATILDACRGNDVRRFVYVSSAEVYGEPERNPVDERQMTQPRSPYGAAKLGAEAMVRALAPAIGVQAVILRPFSVYGPGMRVGSLVRSILDQVLDRDAVVLADVRPVRDYCYVEDVADAVIRAAIDPFSEQDGVYNVGSGTGTSVADLARLAATIVGRDVPIRSGDPDRPAGADIRHLVADIRRIRQDLGWSPRTPLSDGLAATVASLAASETRNA
jgi:nucleoside-diphosphate-sugar epimerase